MEKNNEIIPKLPPVIAYYLVPKNGGFEPHQVIIEEDVMLSDEAINDPDAWDQALGSIEQALSKKFQ